MCQQEIPSVSESSARSHGRKDRFVSLRIIAIAALLALGGLGVAAAGDGETTEGDDPFFEKRGINDRASITLGFMWADMETTAQINSELGLGTTLFLERLFDAPRSRDIPQLLGYYRFNRHHRLDFGYMRVKNEGAVTLLDEEIDVGDITFELNAAVGVRSKVQFAHVQYRYAFVNNGRAEAGIAAGLGLIDADLEIWGQVGIPPEVLYASERVSETIPLPIAGIYTEFTLTKGLFLSVDALLFSLAYGDYAGNVSDSRLSLQWYPTKIFGFGAAYSRTRIDVDIERPRGTVNLDYLIEGPSIFVSFAIPGLQ